MSKKKDKKPLIELGFMEVQALSTHDKFSAICGLSHRHEVQYWLDEPGTPEQRLGKILSIARSGLHQERELRQALDDILKRCCCTRTKNCRYCIAGRKILNREYT